MSRTKSGAVDGGTGRGVRLGGRDAGRGPTGFDQKRAAANDAIEDDDETTPVDDDLTEFFENDDEGPTDRRRDPLRRP